MVKKKRHIEYGKISSFPSLAHAVRNAYVNGEEDERLEPINLVDEEGSPLGRIQKGDTVIFYDIRGEREIEITKSLIEDDFIEFPIQKDMNLNFVTMIEYDKKLDVKVIFPPQEEVTKTLPHVLSENGIKFIKIVESEKAFHLTYFFNGKSEMPLPLEERLIVPSSKIKGTPDSDPKMMIYEVTKAINSKLSEGEIPIIITNLANVDVVGHTENEKAIIKAVEKVDFSLGEIIKQAQSDEVTTIATADHGTVERWLYPDGTIDTGHTSSQVPFILIEPDEDIKEKIELKESGELADVAPTILKILGLKIPDIMTGRPLFSGNPYENHDKKRLLLLILDGWGIRDEEEGNLIKKANTPVFDHLIGNYPSTRLDAAGEAVGMPKGSVGNSEVGHLHLGAGRRILSDRLRIDNSIEDGTFFKDPVLAEAMEDAKMQNKTLHLLGIVSFYSSHGSIDHLKALLQLAKEKGPQRIFIHSILGRRGEHAQSGERYIRDIEDFTKKLNLGKVVTVMGRHWVLDREENWDRIKKAYWSLVFGQGNGVIIENNPGGEND